MAGAGTVSPRRRQIEIVRRLRPDTTDEPPVHRNTREPKNALIRYIGGHSKRPRDNSGHPEPCTRANSVDKLLAIAGRFCPASLHLGEPGSGSTVRIALRLCIPTTSGLLGRSLTGNQDVGHDVNGPAGENGVVRCALSMSMGVCPIPSSARPLPLNH